MERILKAFFPLVLSLCALAAIAQPAPLPDSSEWSLTFREFVVTAQHAPTDSRNSIYQIQTISRQQIEQRGAVNLEQLLTQELNIRISQDLILGSSMQMQGISGQNIKIMIDGVPVIGRVGDDIDLSQILLYQVERVEIVQGPMSVVFGTNALGGVINLITRKSQVNARELQASSQVESIGSQTLQAGAGFRFLKSFYVKAGANYTNFKGFNPFPLTDTLYARTYIWNPKRQYGLNGSIRYDLGDNRNILYTAAFFDERITNLGEIKRPQFKPYAFDEWYNTRREDHALQFNWQHNERWYWNLTAGLNRFRRQKDAIRYEFDTDSSIVQAASQDTTRFLVLVLRPVLSYQRTGSRLKGQFGLDLNYEHGEGPRLRNAAESGSHSSSIADYAVFANIGYQALQGLQLQVGARAAYNSRFEVPLVPSLHIKYDLRDDLVLRASYATGFRSPSIKELYYYFIDASHYIIGNPDLDAETAHQFQAGLEWTRNWKVHAFQATLNGFYTDISDKIELYDFVVIDDQMVPAASVGQSSSNFAYFNLDRFKAFGAQVNLKYKWKRLDVQAGVAPTAKFNPLSETYPVAEYSWATELNGQLNYNFTKAALLASFFVRGYDRLIRYYSGTDNDGVVTSFQAIQDGFWLADISLTKRLWKDRVQIGAGIKNIFDVVNVNSTGVSATGHNSSAGSSSIATGRNFFVRAQVQVGW